MLNNSIKTIALATALTTGAPTVTSAQNRLQDSYKQFLTTEFKKVDINPQDCFVSQAELNEYMGNEDMKVASFDTTNDGLLNIDEFSSIIVPNKKPSKVQESKEIKEEIKKDTYDIVKKLGYYAFNKTKTVTVPGLLWGTNSYQKYDENKIVSTIKRINKDNIFDVTNIFCNTYLVVSKANVSHVCTLSDRTIGYNKQNIYGHICGVIQDVADEKGVGSEVKEILQKEDSQVSKMNEAYNIIASF